MANVESRTCVFCGEHTRKKRKRNLCDTYQEHKVGKIPSSLKKIYNKKLSSPHQPHQPSVVCSVCNSHACYLCVKAICERMKQNELHPEDKWYQQMSEWIYNNNYPNTDFVGHCCELLKSIEKERASSVYRSTESLIQSNNNICYDGYIHLPQLHILIPPPLHNSIDVHGFGKEDELDVPGLLHGVVGYETGRRCCDEQIIPSGKLCVGNAIQSGKFSFVDIHGNKTLIDCRIETFYIDVHVNCNKLKHHHVSLNDISLSKCLVAPSFPTIWIIIAKVSPYSKKAHLVNIRWPSNINLSSKKSKNLFADAMKLVRNNGMETTRTGGSNGLPTFSSYNILRLLKSETAFIRKGKGVKVVKGEKKWHCYYISSGGKSTSMHMVHRVAAKWDAVQPQLGGQFDVSPSFFEKHRDVITNMTIAKYNTALLIPEVNKKINVKIQDGAIFAAKEDINITQKMLEKKGKKI